MFLSSYYFQSSVSFFSYTIGEIYSFGEHPLLKVYELDKLDLLEELQKYELISMVKHLEEHGKLIESTPTQKVVFLHDMVSLDKYSEFLIKTMFDVVSSKFPRISSVFEGSSMKDHCVTIGRYTFSDEYPKRFFANLPEFQLLVMYKG